MTKTDGSRMVILCTSSEVFPHSFFHLLFNNDSSYRSWDRPAIRLLKHLKPNFPHRTSLSISLFMQHCQNLSDWWLTHRHLVNGRHHLSEVTNHLGHWHKNMEFELTKTFSSTDMIMLITCVHVLVTKVMRGAYIVLETNRGRKRAVY